MSIFFKSSNRGLAINNSQNILISVEPRHVENMLSGLKTVELRKRRVTVPAKTRVWIYSKIPVGSVCVTATVNQVLELPTAKLWRLHGKSSAISKQEFTSYFAGQDCGFALMLQNIRRLPRALSLDDIRDDIKGFQPPQFFKRLETGGPELNFFEAAIAA